MGTYVSILKELAQEGRRSKIRNHNEKDIFICTQILKFLTTQIKPYKIYSYECMLSHLRCVWLFVTPWTITPKLVCP